MSSPTFSQSGRPNLTIPLIGIVSLLIVFAGLAYRLLPHSEVSATITSVQLHPIVTTFKRQTQTGGFKLLNDQPASESDLYVIPSVRIDDHINTPLFLKDFHVTLVTADGELHTSAIEKNDLPTVYSAFPEIKPLMAQPLLRESTVAPNSSAQGTILLQFPMPQSVWDNRQSATLTIDFYHQDSLNIPFPKP